MYVIGLNSGTSFDGIDVALVQFYKGKSIPIFVDGLIYKYPTKIKKQIRDLITNTKDIQFNTLRQKEIAQFNFLLGEIFAKAAIKIIKKNKLSSKDILLIASHGQTIYHHPEIENISGHKIKSTLQIGESSVIAQRTGIKIISNFREADIAVNGQGAPLMPYLDYIIFNKSKDIKATLNIGGISNITIVGNGITPIAFDIGPGNALIDLITRQYFNIDYDKDGRLGSKGQICLEDLQTALKDPYFHKKPPKSTGKEYFNVNFIEKYFLRSKTKENKITTITYFTAKVIQQAFKDFIFSKYKINEIIISGGGIKNKTLVNHLTNLFPNISLTTSDKYGLPAKYKEAMLFALLGYTCYLKIPNNLPSCTGATKKVILGKITNV